jgi:hypothetical protein
MRIDLMPGHDVHNLYLRWVIRYDGKEKDLLARLGGPLFLEVETSCYVDLAAVRHEVGRVKIPIWPYAGPQNHGQARFWDVDARRRFWVNLEGAIPTVVQPFIYERKPGSVPEKEGVTLFVPEGVKRAETVPSTEPTPWPAVP